jgi:O-antigen/teichoic acid export membrane protein
VSAPETLEPTDRLGAAEVRRRALSGAMMLGARGFALKAIGLVGNVALARLLTPHDFGVVAIGTTAAMVGAYLADGGLGAGLIRQPQAPSRSLLRSFLGYQLLVTVGVALLAAASTLFLDEVAVVTLVMVASLPIVALRGPARILLERRLRFGPFVIAELVEFLTYYAWSVGTVLLGWGVWGLATGFVVRSIFGTISVLWSVPESVMRPSLRFRPLLPALRFGVKVFAVSSLALVKDQAINMSIAGAGGLGLLGLWSVAQRVLSVPAQIHRALFVVSLPAMSRLSEQDEDPGPLLVRSSVMTGHLSGLVLVPVVATAPAFVPIVFGAAWAPASDALPAACLAIFLAALGPVATGYLSAVDRAGAVVIASVANVAALVVLTPVLTVLFGLQGAATAYLLGTVAECYLLARTVRQLTDARLLRGLARGGLAGVVVGTAGFVWVERAEPGLAGVVMVAVSSALAYAVMLLIVEPRQARDTLGVLWRRVPARIRGRRSAVRGST